MYRGSEFSYKPEAKHLIIQLVVAFSCMGLILWIEKNILRIQKVLLLGVLCVLRERIRRTVTVRLMASVYSLLG
jgi:hypothetical protein